MWSYCWPSCCSFMWYTMSVVYTKNKNSELLLLTNLASRKGKRIPWICFYMKIRWDLEWKQSICLKVHKYRKNNGLLNSFCSSFLLQGILVLSRWRNIGIQAPHIQNPVRFRRFNIVETSRSWGQHLCSKFAEISHLGCPRTFKVPTSSRGLPLGHNIDTELHERHPLSQKKKLFTSSST